jgi:hypothetical protein
MHAVLHSGVIVYATAMTRLIPPMDWFRWTVVGALVTVLGVVAVVVGNLVGRPKTMRICSLAMFERAESITLVNLVVLVSLFGFSAC